MSRIKILDLSLNGSNLLNDPESFLQDLSNQYLLNINGGNSIISQVTVSAGLLVVEQPVVTNDAAATRLNSQESTGMVILL